MWHKEGVIDELCALLGGGEEVVSVAEEVRAEYGRDKWNAEALPEVVVRARSTQDVSRTLAFANERGIPVTTRGAGIGYVGGCVPVRGGILLSVKEMAEILEVNPKDGLARVQSGVITGDLQMAAREMGWYFPPDPASLKECTIGGNVATNAGGPRCLKYGVTKNYVLGLEVVLADGTVVKTGGRSHKNKTGFDLTALFVGSEGLLGVVTEVTVRLIPHPEARGMLTVMFRDFSEAARAVQQVLDGGHLPSALEITDGFTLQAARDYLGADSLPEGEAHLILEIDGRQTAVTAELAELEEFLRTKTAASSVERRDDEAGCERLWQLRRDFSYALRATGLTKLNEDVVVPRSKLVEFVDFVKKASKEWGIPVACFGHAGDGNIHTNLMVKDYDQPEVKQRADAALDELLHWIIAHGGAITGEHGIGLAKSRWFRDAVGEESFNLHQNLKNTLDPKGILNPGKFLD